MVYYGVMNKGPDDSLNMLNRFTRDVPIRGVISLLSTRGAGIFRGLPLFLFTSPSFFTSSITCNLRGLPLFLGRTTWDCATSAFKRWGFVFAYYAMLTPLSRYSNGLLVMIYPVAAINVFIALISDCWLASLLDIMLLHPYSSSCRVVCSTVKTLRLRFKYLSCVLLDDYL